jgi:hypothetical protein
LRESFEKGLKNKKDGLFHNKTPTARVSYYVGFTKHLAKI